MAEETGYGFVSVPKAGTNAGRPTGKKAYLVVFRWDDIQEYARDSKNVRVTTLTFMEGKKPVAIYATNSTQNVYHESSGNPDAKGFLHHADFEIPGSSIEISAFFENNINENLGVINIPCAGDDCKIAGTPCQPLQISQDNSQDNNEANKHTVQMVSTMVGPVLGHIAKTLIPPTDNEELNKILGLEDTGGV